MRRFRIWSILAISLGLYQCAEKPGQAQLFETLDSAATGIGFINRLSSGNEKFSVVDYLYYYNGAGVAAGDINNDGLTDLFFVSNQNANTLYLNRGNFQFEDISVKAGIGGFSDWKTGVTMADVNGDGFLDIYVCAVGDYRGLEGSNELYINNGDGTFNEKSAAYGLDFTGFSTQAVFFDYDHDGDADMYLLTHARHTSRSYDKVMASLLPDRSAADHLFRNDKGNFIDVTGDTGIDKDATGYGMGISIADLDLDGWEDIYVTNDFAEADRCYMNNHDGTFREEGKERFGHFSRFSKGCDIADVNNDGYEDIITTDLYSPDERIEKRSFNEEPWDVHDYKISYGNHPQVSRNCLHINNGGVNFSDRAIMSGVYATDWSWSPLLADFNNDGHKDILITSGIARRLNDLAYLDFSHQDSMRYAPQLTAQQVANAIGRMPEGRLHNFIYEGGSDLTFEDRSAAWGMTTPGLSSGAVYADLDNDGDLDLIISNINAPAGIHQNRANEILKNNYVTVQLKGPEQNRFGTGARICLKTKDGLQVQQVMPTRGFLSSMAPVVHFGMGKNIQADSLTIQWNDGHVQVLTNVQANSHIVADHGDASVKNTGQSLQARSRPIFEDVTAGMAIGYTHRENKYSDYHREGLMPSLVSAEGPGIATGDVNGDGLEDIFAGSAKHHPASIYFQQRNGSFTLSEQPALRTDSAYEDVDAVFLDIDGDQDQDLYVVSGGNEFYGKMEKQFDRIYRNDGKGNFSRDAVALPPMYDNKSCVRPCDADNDGDPDLFVGGRVVGYGYGRSPRSYLLVNNGTGNFTDETSKLAPALGQAGMITDAVWTDIDNDQDQDLVLAGDWMPLKIFVNENGHLDELNDIIDAGSVIKDLNGFWQCVLAGDFDNDGDTDLMAGNLGMNTNLRRNGAQSAVNLYIADLDHDQRPDHILSYNRPDGKFYPASSREEWVKQMPSMMGEYFKDNTAFAGHTTEALFSAVNIELPEPLVVNQFASLYLENTGRKTLIAKMLPPEAQVSKIFSFCRGDFNGDGNTDVLAGGNHYGAAPYQGRYDASYGCVLNGDGKGNFTTAWVHETGLNLTGQVRHIKPLETPAGTVYLMAKNGGALQVISVKRKSKLP